MARGYPDFFGQAKFSNWGPQQIQTELNNTIPNLTTRSIFLLENPSIIYGGHLYLSHDTNFGDLVLTLTIDGTIFISEAIQYFKTTSWVEDNNLPISLIYYDTNDVYATFSFSHAYNFGVSFQIELRESGILTEGHADGWLWYSEAI